MDISFRCPETSFSAPYLQPVPSRPGHQEPRPAKSRPARPAALPHTTRWRGRRGGRGVQPRWGGGTRSAAVACVAQRKVRVRAARRCRGSGLGRASLCCSRGTRFTSCESARLPWVEQFGAPRRHVSRTGEHGGRVRAAKAGGSSFAPDQPRRRAGHPPWLWP